MVLFYKFFNNKHFAVKVKDDINQKQLKEIDWLFGSGMRLSKKELEGIFVGPKKGITESWVSAFKKLAKERKITGLIDIAGLMKQDTKEIDFNPIFNRLYENVGQNLFSELK